MSDTHACSVDTALGCWRLLSVEARSPAAWVGAGGLPLRAHDPGHKRCHVHGDTFLLLRAWVCGRGFHSGEQFSRRELSELGARGWAVGLPIRVRIQTACAPREGRDSEAVWGFRAQSLRPLPSCPMALGTDWPPRPGF